MDAHLKEIARTFFEMDMLDRSAARLFLRILDGEPPTLTDLRAILADRADKPSFLGGPEHKRACPFRG